MEIHARQLNMTTFYEQRLSPQFACYFSAKTSNSIQTNPRTHVATLTSFYGLLKTRILQSALELEHRPPTLNPSQPTWPVSLPVGCYRPHPPSPFISITQPESRTLILASHGDWKARSQQYIRKAPSMTEVIIDPLV